MTRDEFAAHAPITLEHASQWTTLEIEPKNYPRLFQALAELRFIYADEMVKNTRQDKRSYISADIY